MLSLDLIDVEYQFLQNQMLFFNDRDFIHAIVTRKNLLEKL